MCDRNHAAAFPAATYTKQAKKQIVIAAFSLIWMVCFLSVSLGTKKN